MLEYFLKKGKKEKKRKKQKRKKRKKKKQALPRYGTFLGCCLLTLRLEIYIKHTNSTVQACRGAFTTGRAQTNPSPTEIQARLSPPLSSYKVVKESKLDRLKEMYL